MPPGPPQTVAVLGRYEGVTAVLTQLLTTAGLEVSSSWAADRDGADLRQALVGAAVAVVTVAPDDPTLSTLRAAGWRGRVVAVTWHPTDELEPLGPIADAVVTAGAIAAELPPAVVHLLRGGQSPHRSA